MRFGFTIRRVLLVQGSPAETLRVAHAVRGVRDMAIDLMVAPSVVSAAEHLRRRRIDLMLLDLSLLELGGIEALRALLDDAPGVPVIALSRDGDAEAREAIAAGAQDCLAKDRLEPEILGRAMSHAIERHRQLGELRAQSLRDELTKLHNRRGFFLLAEQLARSLRRSRRPALILFADVDGLKAANDTYGHGIGDRLLIDAGRVLLDGFREGDVVARIGGDEFAVLALDAEEDEGRQMVQRIERMIDERNQRALGPPDLAMSLGVYALPVGAAESLQAIVARADQEMYAKKRARRAPTGRANAGRQLVH